MMNKMSITQITLPTAAQSQLDNYNGSRMVARSSYSVPQGTNWAIIGLVLVDAATPEDEAALVAALTGLAGISAVGDPRLWGQLPATLETGDTHQCKLHTTVTLGCTAGTANNNWSLQERKHATVAPPLGKKWLVVNCAVPSPLTNQMSVDTLESACEGIVGVTTAKVLAFGSVPNPATGVVVTVESRMRIDPVT